MKAKVILNGVEKEVDMPNDYLIGIGFKLLNFTNYAHRPRVQKYMTYWYIEVCGRLSYATEEYSNFDEESYLFGNYFHTKAEAIAKRDEILAKQKAYDEEMIKKGGK